MPLKLGWAPRWPKQACEWGVEKIFAIWDVYSGKESSQRGMGGKEKAEVLAYEKINSETEIL